MKLADIGSDARNLPWGLWWVQGWRLVQVELRRNLFSLRAGWIYCLAFLPTLIISIHTFFAIHTAANIADDTNAFAGIVQLYYIRLGIFFGCLGIFSRLIRGEMTERSLHFYLLLPIPRELLLLAKFLAGSITAVLLFSSALITGFVLLYAGYGVAGWDYVFNGPGLSQLGAYLLISVLACMGYGALFLLLGMMFINPMLPAMLLLGWEAINPLLPVVLQRVSVSSYLRHLMPVSVPMKGIFALLTVQTEPIAAWAATLGLLSFVVVVLVYSCYRMRSLEIRYTTD